VNGWPCLQVEVVDKHLAVEKRCNLDALLHDVDEIVLEQVRVDV